MKHLERRLNLTAVVTLSISSMLGSGIFVLPGIAVNQSGGALWLAYLLAACCVLPAAMSKAELATAMPTSGGTYVYLERTFGPFVGTVSGLGLWLSLLLKSAFALVGISSYLYVLADFPLKYVALFMLIAIVALNISGVAKVSGAVFIIVVISLVTLVVVSGFSIGHMTLDQPALFYSNGVSSLMAAAGLVFVSYAGVTKVAAIAEEVKEPEKNLPRGILVSLGLVTIIYCIVSFILVATLSPDNLIGDLRPIHSLSVLIGGERIGMIVAIVAILTMFSMANAGLLAASRFPFAMSRDRLLPSPIGRLNSKFLTPTLSIVLSGVMIAGSIVFFDVEKIAKLASGFMLMIYIAENIAVVVLRETRVQWYEPRYKAPLYPFLQLFGIVSGTYILINMGTVILSAFVSISIPGIILYLLYSRHKIDRRGVLGIRGKRRDIIKQEAPIVKYTYDQSEREANVIVALFGIEKSPDMLVEFGVAISDAKKVEIAHITEVPEQTDIHDLLDEPNLVQSVRRRVDSISQKNNVPIQYDHIYSHDIFKTVHEMSRQLHCEWVIKEWGGHSRGTFTIHRQMGWLEDHLMCHVLTFRDAGVRYISKILVLIEKGTHEALVIDTADHLAQVYGADITYAAFVERDVSEEEYTDINDRLRKIAKMSKAKTEVLMIVDKHKVRAMVSASTKFDLLIVEATSEKTKYQRYFGTDKDKIMGQAACSVVMVQAYDP